MAPPVKETLSAKALNNLKFILTDIISGDNNAIKNPAFAGLDMVKIQYALKYLLADDRLSQKQQAHLLSNSYRINFRDKPPTPVEFVTNEKWLGKDVLKSLRPHIISSFIEFFDTNKPYRNAVLSTSIGWGKSFLSTLITLYISVNLIYMRDPKKYFGFAQPLDCKVLTPDGFVEMGSIEVGDKIITPKGEITEVIQIHPQGVIPTYEIELEDGRKTRCSAHHRWKVSYRKDSSGEKIWETVMTQFMIDNPNIEFEIPDVEFTTDPGSVN